MTAPGRLLVTGGTGFVGVHVCKGFASKGWQVVALDLHPRSVDIWKEAAARITVVRGDVTDWQMMNALTQQFAITAIVHAAALIREEDCRSDSSRAVTVNVGGTVTMLEAARRRRIPIVCVSTCAMYGHRPDLSPLSEDAPVSPYGVYDTTKRMAELIAEAYHKVHGVDVVVVRTGFVYGPGPGAPEHRQQLQAAPVARGGVGALPYLSEAMRGVAIRESTGGDHPSEWTYAGDLADGIFRALTVRPIQHRVFNITGGRLYTRRDLADAVRRAIPGASVEIGPGLLPEGHLRGACDLARARAELGYEPRYPLDRGIAETIGWFQEQMARTR